MRTSPLLLSFADMAYVAASPVSRSALVLVNFVQAWLPVLAVALPLLALVVVVIAQPLGSDVAHWAALRAAVTAAPVVLLLVAVSWIMGLLRLDARARRFSRWWWLLGLLCVPLSLFPPFRWPGAAIARAVAEPVDAVMVTALWLAAALVATGVATAGRRVDLIAVSEESQTYARINALGLMALLAPDLSARIRRQESLARGRARYALPRGGTLRTLAARSLLLVLRRPLPAAGLLLWGASAALSAGWLVLSQAPITLWFFWVTFLTLRPPTLLVETFQSDMQEPYLRQLLPLNNLGLALAGGTAPLGLALIGAWTGWGAAAVMAEGLAAAVGGVVPSAAGVTAGLLLAALGCSVVLLAQAAAFVRVEPMGARLPYAGWFLIALAGTGLAMVVASPLPGALLGASLMAATLAFTIFSGRRLTL